MGLVVVKLYCFRLVLVGFGWFSWFGWLVLLVWFGSVGFNLVGLGICCGCLLGVSVGDCRCQVDNGHM